jgi:hypothetical protein
MTNEHEMLVRLAEMLDGRGYSCGRCDFEGCDRDPDVSGCGYPGAHRCSDEQYAECKEMYNILTYVLIK